MLVLFGFTVGFFIKFWHSFQFNYQKVTRAFSLNKLVKLMLKVFSILRIPLKKYRKQQFHQKSHFKWASYITIIYKLKNQNDNVIYTDKTRRSFYLIVFVYWRVVYIKKYVCIDICCLHQLFLMTLWPWAGKGNLSTLHSVMF